MENEIKYNNKIDLINKKVEEQKENSNISFINLEKSKKQLCIKRENI